MTSAAPWPHKDQPIPSGRAPLLDLRAYDRTPWLTAQEQATLEAMAQSPFRWGSQELRVVARNRQTLARLLRPLDDALAAAPGRTSRRQAAKVALMAWCHRLSSTYWQWEPTTWRRILGVTQAEYLAANPGSARGDRPYIVAAAYRLGCFRQLPLLGSYDRFSVASKVFGPNAVGDAVGAVEGILAAWGYAATGNIDLRSQVCEILLMNESPLLEDVTADFLDELRRGASPARRSLIRQVSRALAALGVLDRPLEILWPAVPHSKRHDGPSDVDPAWRQWLDRWVSTSTLSWTTRRATRGVLLKAGRWLRECHPEVTSPDMWDRGLAAEFVAAIDRMRPGDYASRQASCRNRHQAQLSPRSKDSYLSAMRVFFADCQSWEWIATRFDPWRTFATPRSVKALIGPSPRTVAPDVWARLVCAGMTLSAEDVAENQTYPFECVRALSLVWLFAGLRSDEIVRLRVGCIRRQAADLHDEASHADAICLLDVPVNKTGTAFTKPVDPVVGQAVDAWERARPQQPRSADRKTGEMVDLLFCFRARPMPREYINHSLIPLLCRKAGVPLTDARGRITSHRARATIATQLFNARRPLSLSELQAWLGHRSPTSTQSYVIMEPARLAAAYAAAGYLDRNVRAIAVLIDQDAIKSGAAAAGEPWRYYDLGHGLCSYEFFDQCPHRMACPGCDFYRAKDASLEQFLAAKTNLLQLLQEEPLTDDQRAAAERDLTTLQRLTDHLGRPNTGSPPARCGSQPCADLK